MTTDEILQALAGLADRNPLEARVIDELKIEIMNRRTRALACEAALHDAIKVIEKRSKETPCESLECTKSGL